MNYYLLAESKERERTFIGPLELFDTPEPSKTAMEILDGIFPSKEKAAKP